MDFSSLLPRTLLRKARAYTRKLWVRVVGMGLMAFLALGLTQLVEPLVPEKLARSLGGAAADRLLDIIANAMLAVTIFSITVMVSVYQSSSSQFTPRIHRLIVQDRTTQNTMAVFIGAYVYALLGIILRETGVYVDERALVLFWMTVAVLIVIVVYLVRWVLHLQTFGSLINTTRQIESSSIVQFKERLEKPCLGGRPLTKDVPNNAQVICARESGYVQHIYPEQLQAIAQRHDVELYLERGIGSFVFVNAPLLYVVGQPKRDTDEGGTHEFEEALHNALSIGDLRTFDQDPRFGLVVMGEVASKALSPGVNDPGTAINVITRLGRILSLYRDEADMEQEVELDRLHVRPLDPVDLIGDAFAALARDGAAVVEVQQRLQVVLAGLMRHPDKGLSVAAQQAAQIHLARAMHSIDFGPDSARVMGSAHVDVRRAVEHGTTDTD